MFLPKVVAESTPTTTTIPAEKECHFYRHDLPPEINNFGPAGPEDDAEKAKAEFLLRLQGSSTVGPDGALLVATDENQTEFTTPEVRTLKTVQVCQDQAARNKTTQRVVDRLKEAKSAEIVEMTGDYQSLYMTDTPVPGIFKARVDRPTFKVLRFVYEDGKQENYKLSCGFQPVAVDFPGVPGFETAKAVAVDVAPVAPKPPAPGPGPSPTTTVRPSPTTTPPPPTTAPPCIHCKPVPSTTIAASPGTPGTPDKGAAANPGTTGGTASDPIPDFNPVSTTMPYYPPTTWAVTIPTTTAPPPPSQNLDPGGIPG